MKGEKMNNIDVIVQTLLQVAERVLEVSDAHVVTEYWDRSGSDRVLEAIQNAAIVKQYGTTIDECIKNGTTHTIAHNVVTGLQVAQYNIRVLPIHPAEKKAFVGIEYISIKSTEAVSEHYWEQALDAAGDGMWDVQVQSEIITFSEKWHTIFGYSNERINTIEKWLSIIHPDDLQSVQRRRIEYFEGNTKYYHSEFRLKCGDGNYKWVLSRGVIVARAEDGTPLRFTGTHTDIHDRKQTEEKLSTTVQMLAKLINNLQEGILVTDENKSIIFANQIFCDIYNIGIHPNELIGLDALAGVDARKGFYENPEHFYNRTIEILDKKEIVLNEEWQMKSGKIISRDFIPLVLGNNNIGGIWKFKDVTVQKNAENQIAELRNFYELILNSIATDIVVFDAEQRYLFINPTAIKDADFRQWMIGKTDEDYVRVRNKAYDLVKRRRDIFIKARDEKRVIEWEEMLINRQGNPEYHLRYMCPIFDKNGDHQLGIGYGVNITDRVLAKQALKTSNDTFSSAFNDSGIGMALVGIDGKWIDVNDVLCEMTGFSKQDLMKLTFRDLTHPDDLNIDMGLIKDTIRKRIRTYSIEKKYISRQNKIIQALLTVSLVREIDDKPKFYIAQIIDITAKKEMEWQLRANNAELLATKETLLNKINQLEDLSYIIAHNLRGPAGNIKMLAEEAMLTHLGGSNNPNDQQQPAITGEEALCMIHDSSISLLDSLATLMQVTEIKLNKEIPHDNCDIAPMINEICNQQQSIIFEKQAVIHRIYDVAAILYPRVYLENILYNLLSNALKYTKAGVQPEITITTRKTDKGKNQIVVKDNGLGIDTEKYSDKLFKLNEVFHSGFESKGVGLYITKTQVESFGGTIELKSKPNEGCEFTVTL